MSLHYFERNKGSITEAVMLHKNLKVSVVRSSTGISAKYKILKEGNEQLKQLAKVCQPSDYKHFYSLFTEYTNSLKKYNCLLPQEKTPVPHG